MQNYEDLPLGPDNEEEVGDVEYNVCHGALLEVLLRERVKGVNPHPTLILRLEGDANTAQLGVCVKNQNTLKNWTEKPNIKFANTREPQKEGANLFVHQQILSILFVDESHHVTLLPQRSQPVLKSKVNIVVVFLVFYCF